MTDEKKIRLTQLSHGGGCGCKIAPSVLQEMLATMTPGVISEKLLVGSETSDDAAVYRLNDEQAIIATTDFFMPIVDDPFDFGRIAATNALSDVYAMGGAPIMALAIVGMPLDKLPVSVIGRILEGGNSVCRDAGIPVAGGHSIDTVEPIYGLAALGIVSPNRVRSNAAGKAGDVLILGKPLGVGILSAALKKGMLDDAGYQTMLRVTTQLNNIGAELSANDAIHAMTDVTGFGLLGHLLEICRGSHCAAEITFDALPLIGVACDFVRAGVKTGASTRNWDSYGNDIMLQDIESWQQTLLTDPQTSGGLLVTCSPESAAEVLRLFYERGYTNAAIIGCLEERESKSRIFVRNN
ncbi:MAG: selenide, water dikinase SelD [Burkholderiales bacterium]|jgi:selenide,water dikinase|nr:selenide, water dikinase SelD [Burkholderiales bacterium]